MVQRAITGVNNNNRNYSTTSFSVETVKNNLYTYIGEKQGRLLNIEVLKTYDVLRHLN